MPALTDDRQLTALVSRMREYGEVRPDDLASAFSEMSSVLEFLVHALLHSDLKVRPCGVANCHLAPKRSRWKFWR